MLQRARGAPPRSTDEPSGTTTPKAHEAAVSTGSPSSESDVSEATREREEQYDRWLENMRVIETLREYVRSRLDRRDFIAEEAERARLERDGDAMDVDVRSPKHTSHEMPRSKDGPSLYPILPVPGS